MKQFYGLTFIAIIIGLAALTVCYVWSPELVNGELILKIVITTLVVLLCLGCLRVVNTLFFGQNSSISSHQEGGKD